MASNVDHNALLLQVMAHDLLAPLTAVKWQSELLASAADDPAKRDRYLSGIQSSTELGITLTKHAHVAGKVLTESYVPDPSEGVLSDVIRTALNDLHLQYERHGIGLEVEMRDSETSRSVDVPLVSLYVWSLAKYFLTMTPAQGTVTFRGIPAEDGSYTVAVSAPDVPEREECVRHFSDALARDAYDQTYVFIKLIKTAGPMVGATETVAAQEDLLLLETVFR